MANLTPKSFYIGNESASNAYTTANTVGNYSIIKNINLCNATSSNAVCSVHILVGGASPAANNKIVSNVNVLANNVVWTTVIGRVTSSVDSVSYASA